MLFSFNLRLKSSRRLDRLIVGDTVSPTIFFKSLLTLSALFAIITLSEVQMKTYTFTYFVMDENGKYVASDFSVRSNRFTQAFYCFSRFFNDIFSNSGFRDYSCTYSLANGDYRVYRVIPTKYLSSLRRCVPEI